MHKSKPDPSVCTWERNSMRIIWCGNTLATALDILGMQNINLVDDWCQITENMCRFPRFCGVQYDHSE
jgi:hypothetical protein